MAGTMPPTRRRRRHKAAESTPRASVADYFCHLLVSGSETTNPTYNDYLRWASD